MEVEHCGDNGGPASGPAALPAPLQCTARSLRSWPNSDELVQDT